LRGLFSANKRSLPIGSCAPPASAHWSFSFAPRLLVPPPAWLKSTLISYLTPAWREIATGAVGRQSRWQMVETSCKHCASQVIEQHVGSVRQICPAQK